MLEPAWLMGLQERQAPWVLSDLGQVCRSPRQKSQRSWWLKAGVWLFWPAWSTEQEEPFLKQVSLGCSRWGSAEPAGHRTPPPELYAHGLLKWAPYYGHISTDLANGAGTSEMETTACWADISDTKKLVGSRFLSSPLCLCIWDVRAVQRPLI